MDLSYNFNLGTGNNGRVFGITNNTDPTRSQTFTYDQLNRITAAQTTSTFATSPAHCWEETYSLDSWGNMQSLVANTDPRYTGCTYEPGFTKTADGYNHLSGFSYDASGNTTADGYNSYTWDAESQLKVTAGSTYLYDGDGRRVAKANTAAPPVPYKLYWYGSGGAILAETNATGATLNEYIYFGGKRVALLPAGSTAQFYAEDFLGSSRVVTTNTGVVCYDADFYPYGGERAYVNSCLQNNYKFEGKERDTETGNDDFGARYYSNRFGRWLSADWSSVPVPVPYANLTNPQTLNLYAMVADDPESFADLDGHCIWDGCLLEGAAVVVGLAVAGYAIYKGVTHLQEAVEHGEKAEAARGQIIDMATPNAPDRSQPNIDANVETYKNETAAELNGAVTAGSEVNSGLGTLSSTASAAISGNPAASSLPAAGIRPAANTEKALGAGVSTGTKGVKALIKATKGAPGGQAQQQQSASPSIWGGLKALFSSPPPPPLPTTPVPPQAQKPPCSTSPASNCP
jgi:RHS repeat-associated protein